APIHHLSEWDSPPRLADLPICRSAPFCVPGIPFGSQPPECASCAQPFSGGSILAGAELKRLLHGVTKPLSAVPCKGECHREKRTHLNLNQASAGGQVSQPFISLDGSVVET